MGWTYWRSQNPLTQIIIKENPTGKIPLGKPRLRWDDIVRNYVKSLWRCLDWRIQAADIENWRQVLVVEFIKKEK